MAKEKKIEKHREWLRTFLADPFNNGLLNDTPLREVASYLAKDKLAPPDAGLLAMHAGSIGAFVFRTGALEILDGKAAGWSKIHQGLQLHSLELRGDYFQMIKHPKKSDRASWMSYRVTGPIIHALAVGDLKWADELVELLIRAITHGVSNPDNYYGFEPFVVNLYQVSRGEERHNPAFREPERSDEYAGIWKHWNSADELGKECQRLCDLHMHYGGDEARVNRDEQHAQFFEDEFLFYPVEILAIQRVRQRLGLPVPICKHDLMKSPFADAPVTPPQIEDNLAERIEAKLKSFYEGF